ncbi:MAG: pilus assembly protein CpaE [Actinomycetota bacterium]|nr:pilus assembly protein CpaE [Actinomycetota bacterium]
MRNPKILVVEKDADLADQVRGVAGDLRPRPEVVPCDRLAIVNEVIASSGPFDVMIAGPTLGTKASLTRLQALHDESPSMSLLLAFDKRPDAALRDIVRTGALDLLQLPVSDRMLHDAIERAVSVSRPRMTSSAATSVAPGHGKQGTVFTVASATGGCGKTFYATNLAYFLHQHTGKRTCIIDLDLQFGEVSTALRLRPRFTISDVLSREEQDQADLEAHIQEYVVAHDSGVYVLAAPKDPSDADRIHPTDVSRVIEAARAKFDYVVVDTPAALTEIVLAAFDLSDQLYIMATMDLPSVRNMGVFLNTLDKLKIPSDNVKLILNKAEKDVGIDVEQITKLFSQGFASVLPYAREVIKSVNVGTPILAFNPNSEVSRRLAAGLVPLLPEGMQSPTAGNNGDAGGARKQGLFARIFHLSPQSTGS